MHNCILDLTFFQTKKFDIFSKLNDLKHIHIWSTFLLNIRNFPCLKAFVHDITLRATIRSNR